MSEGNFEAKVSAKRETSAGIFLTLQIQPDDYKSELATLRVGSALMMGWAEVLNSEVEPIEPYQPEPPTVTLTATKERRPFASLPLSQQAAIRCGDEQFQGYIIDRFAGHLPYRPTADNAAILVREHCGVSSRSDIKAGTPAGGFWEDLEDAYQGYLTTQRYASVAR